MSVISVCRFSSSLFRLFTRLSPNKLAEINKPNNIERMFTSQKILLNQKEPEIQNNEKNPEDSKKHILGRIDRKLKLSFTCKKCNCRNTKIISKLSYEKGIVIVRCDGCKNNHLIADHLGWFPHLEKKLNNLDYLLRTRAKEIERMRNNTDVYFEAISKDLMNDSETVKTMKDLTTKVQTIEEELKENKNKILKNNESINGKNKNGTS